MKFASAVTWTPKAAKQLRKLDVQFQKQVLDATQTLAAMPNCQNVVALTCHHYGYRLRVGNFRVLFDWSSVIKIVSIEEVKKRDESTY